MPYEIGFAPRSRKSVSVAHKASAVDTLKTVNDLRASDEEIRYIKAPEGYEIGIGELQLLAERESGHA